jgi:outer membrane lipoprotein-sorting protein
MNRRVALVLLIVLLVAGSESARSESASSIVEKARNGFAAINDYSADMRLDMKGDKVSVKGMVMRFYYKKPDKTRVIAKDGFAAVPRNLGLGNPLKELSKNARPTLLRTEKKQGTDCYVLQLDPVNASGAPSMLVWIDRTRYLVRATSTLGPNKLDTVWSYTRVGGKHDLPSRIEADLVVPGETGNRPTKATVTFSNYQVNKGISDSIFQVQNQAKRR